MAHKKRKYLILLILAIILAALWWYYRDEPDVAQQPHEDPSLIFNRLWVDSKPKKDTDYIHAMVVLNKLPIGAFQRASAYRLLAERFDYRRKRDTLDLFFPQTEWEAKLSFRVWSCKELPPYDLCLELSKNPWESGPRRYYGMREQNRASDRHKALRRRLLHTLGQP